HVPVCAGAHVALDALDARVRARKVGRELRVHHGVARLAAELYGLCVLVRAVAAEGAGEEEDEEGGEEAEEVAPASRVVEVERWVARNLAGREAVTPAPLQQRAEDCEHEAEDEQRREDDVREDA